MEKIAIHDTQVRFSSGCFYFQTHVKTSYVFWALSSYLLSWTYVPLAHTNYGNRKFSNTLNNIFALKPDVKRMTVDFSKRLLCS